MHNYYCEDVRVFSWRLQKILPQYEKQHIWPFLAASRWKERIIKHKNGSIVTASRVEGGGNSNLMNIQVKLNLFASLSFKYHDLDKPF